MRELGLKLNYTQYNVLNDRAEIPINGENLRQYRAHKLKAGRRSIKKKRYPYKQHDLIEYEGKLYAVIGMQNKGAGVFPEQHGISGDSAKKSWQYLLTYLVLSFILFAKNKLLYNATRDDANRSVILILYEPNCLCSKAFCRKFSLDLLIRYRLIREH